MPARAASRKVPTGLTFLRIATPEPEQITTDPGLHSTVGESRIATETISAIDPTVTASKNRRNAGESWTIDPRRTTTAASKNAGTKMPMVAIAAPYGPFKRYPTKVAIENTGPGVT